MRTIDVIKRFIVELDTRTAGSRWSDCFMETQLYSSSDSAFLSGDLIFRQKCPEASLAYIIIIALCLRREGGPSS